MNKHNDRIYRTFIKRYEATVRSGRPMRRTVPNFDYLPYRYESKPFYDELKVQDVPSVEIDMPQECFESLLDIFGEIENPNSDWGKFEYYNKHLGPGWIERVIYEDTQRTRESKIRDSNPGLKKAWENYQLMLKLSGG